MTLFQAFLSSPKARGALSKRPGDKGFSLIELVVVVAILAILAAVALPNFLGVSKDGQIAAAKNTLATAIKECAVKETRTNSGTIGKNGETGEEAPIQAVSASLNGYSISKSKADAKSLAKGDAALKMDGTDKAHSCYLLAAVNPEGALPHFQVVFDSNTGSTSKECTRETKETYVGGCYQKDANGNPDTSKIAVEKTVGYW